MIECPYCEKDVIPGEGYDQEVLYEQECSYCGMTFTYFIQYEPSYTSQKAPCLNGGDHDFKKIIGCPEEYFKDKYRCSYCEQEIIIKEDDIDRINS